MFAVKVKSWWNPDAVKARLVAEYKVGMSELAEFVAERYRAGVGVDTGRLRASIHVVSEADGLRHHIIAPVAHAEPHEFGYRHWISGRQIPPNPAFRKALNDGARAMPQFLHRNTRVNQGFRSGRLMGATFQ